MSFEKFVMPKELLIITDLVKDEKNKDYQSSMIIDDLSKITQQLVACGNVTYRINDIGNPYNHLPISTG